MKNNKTKTILIILVCVFLWIAFLCFKDRSVTISKDSEEYSDFEINSAIVSAKLYFFMNFRDCELLTIGYVGDESIEAARAWAKDSNAGKAIILNMSFKSGSNWQETGLDPDKVYEKWQLIMIKRLGIFWFVKTNGYG
ncbi:MAG: hypothetical protein Q4D13_06150 [Erysipelotrichaceae bacterium]|nr:hypothetical protein [Erysipelotrichaceae bacterium]